MEEDFIDIIMSSKRLKVNKRVFWISLWVIPQVFYVVFAVTDGVAWCADSNSYLEMHDCREPLYPTMLALFRLLFRIGTAADPHSNISLNAVVMIQSVLAAFASSSLSVYLIKKYIIKETEENISIKEYIYAYLLAVIPLMVSMLNRFAAGRASMYSNSIMTEGLTISFYLLTFRFLLEYVDSESRYSYIMSCLWVFLGIATRKQMYVLLCLLAIALFYVNIFKKLKEKDEELKTSVIVKGLSKLMITLIAIVGLVLLFDCSYNKSVRGVFVPHTEDNRFVSTMAFYTAERSYSEYIDPELRDIYLQIYDECDANGWLMHDAPTKWNDAMDHFSDNYDLIQLNTMQLMLEDYVDKADFSGFKDGMTKTEKIDAVRASFNSSLIVHEKGRLLRVFINNLLCGLVDTVAKRSRLLCIYAALIYAVFGVLALITIKHTMTLSCLTALGILGNVTLVSAVIFCQTRYTIYNMPLFYMTLVIMIYVFLNNRSKRGTTDHV